MHLQYHCNAVKSRPPRAQLFVQHASPTTISRAPLTEAHTPKLNGFLEVQVDQLDGSEIWYLWLDKIRKRTVWVEVYFWKHQPGPLDGILLLSSWLHSSVGRMNISRAQSCYGFVKLDKSQPHGRLITLSVALQSYVAIAPIWIGCGEPGPAEQIPARFHAFVKRRLFGSQWLRKRHQV